MLQLSFYLLNFREYSGIESAWLGVHFIDSQYRNVNGDNLPDDVLNAFGDSSEDHCLLYKVATNPLYEVGSLGSSRPYSFNSCDEFRPKAGICTRRKHGKRFQLCRLCFDKHVIKKVMQVLQATHFVFIESLFVDLNYLRLK